MRGVNYVQGSGGVKSETAMSLETMTSWMLLFVLSQLETVSSLETEQKATSALIWQDSSQTKESYVAVKGDDSFTTADAKIWKVETL